MNISILCLGSPFDTQAAYSAYRYTEAALSEAHKVERVFFYQQGIHNGSTLATPPQDEFNLYEAWQDLQQEYKLDLVICIAAAARRGIIDSSEAKRHNKDAANLASGFVLSGLGQLIEAMASTDRFITFGR
jgi:tRNA 2-thiouridine synthesizing protein D